MVTAASSTDVQSLPSGVLTFLMTDVVDSTMLWESAPGLMDSALTRHDHLIESVVLQHSGILLKHRGEGDSTFCVFASASEAAAAAIEMQRRIAAETWDEATPISVRMGLHTGETILRGRDYYGQTINRAARVRAVARGGQVLLSGTCASLIGSSLPAGTDLRFVRHEKLRGIERPEPIHELVDRHRPLPPMIDLAQQVVLPLPRTLERSITRGFAGRREIIAELDAAIRSARAGTTRIVLLGGEAGAGKTSLAATAARSAHDQGWVVLAGTCDAGISAPYQPFREVFGQYVDWAPGAVLAQHVTLHGGEIGRLAPTLSARVGVVAPVETLDPETTRQLLMEAGADLVWRAARDRPLMLVLDDLHWADRNTLLLIRRLSRMDEGTSLLIVGSYRTEHADDGDLGELLTDLRSLPRFCDLAVGGLDEGGLVDVLEKLAGHGLGDQGTQLARYLVDQTGGNPYFTTELIRHFVETGIIGSDERGRWSVRVELATVAVPRTIRSVLQQRVNRLDDDSQRVLGVAAVAGREFDTKLLAAVMARTELDVLDAVESAGRSSLVRETNVGHFEFAHALVRQTVYEALGATRRGLYHQQIAETLEADLGERAPARVLAEHWAATGRDERAKVALWSRRAGTAAMAALSPEDALVWFRRALDAAVDERERLPLLVDLGDAHRWAGNEAFRRTLLDAASLADRLGDHDALIRAALANNRGGTSASGVVDAERVAVLERALAVVGPDDSAQRACLLATLAIELSQGEDWSRRIAMADDAVATARRLGDEVTLLKVLLLTTEATRLPSTLDTRLVDTDELFSIAKRLGDPVLLGTAAVRQVRVKIEAARFDQLDDALAVLDEVAHLNPYARWNRLILHACLAQIRGDLPSAMRSAAEARTVATADGQPDASAIYVAQIADMHWDAGTLGSLQPMIEQTVRDNPTITGFRAFLGLAYCDMDRFDEAASILRHEVATGFSEHPLSPIWLITMSVFASLCIELDDSDGARLLYDILQPWRGRANASTVSTNGLVTESLAGLALACGRLDQAQGDCDEAIAQARRIGAQVSEVRTRLTAARLALRRGAADDVDTAIDDTVLDDTVLDDIAAVRADAARLGLGTVLRRADQLADTAAARKVG